MTRKELKVFDSAKLRNAHTASFETRNPETGYGEHHYFYRDSDGELFMIVNHRLDACIEARKEWQKLKRSKSTELKQLDLMESEKTSPS